MAKRDPERTRKIRIAVRYLLERDCLAKGNQSRLAEHFQVSRQRIHQIVVEERQRLVGVPAPAAALRHQQQASTAVKATFMRPMAGA
jgi:hypothetical protein